MNKLSKDLFFSTGFAVLNVLLNFWLIKEAEYLLSALALSIFLVMRRVVPTFTNLSQLGTSQALIRYASINKNDKDKIKTYFAISFTIWACSCIVLMLLYVGFGSKLGSLIYNEVEGADNFEPYFLITVWYIAIIHLSYLVQPYFLVQRKIFLYNVINMINASLILLVVIKYVATISNAGEIVNSIVVKIDLSQYLQYALIVMSIVQVTLMVYIIIQLKIYNYPSVEKLKEKQSDTFCNYCHKYGHNIYYKFGPRYIITHPHAEGGLVYGYNENQKLYTCPKIIQKLKGNIVYKRNTYDGYSDEGAPCGPYDAYGNYKPDGTIS